jgi:pimeloyl-ACP methyl ester carboxylesterase
MRKVLSENLNSCCDRLSEVESKHSRRIRVHLTGPAIILLSLLAGGCSYFAKAPLETETYKTVLENEHRNLIVFIRALYGNHKTFEKEGFVAMVRDKGLSYDMVAPNTHLAYYYARNLGKRLKEDVIEPARVTGYTNIWLVGVSMGGLGSILYLLNYPEDSGITGIILLAPFLGEREILQEIIQAGGVRKWEPGDYGDNDWQRLLWDWLKRYDEQQGRLPPIYLGYGDDDSYSVGQGLLAAILPRDHVIVIEGTHSVDTVKELWAIMLNTVPFE